MIKVDTKWHYSKWLFLGTNDHTVGAKLPKLCEMTCVRNDRLYSTAAIVVADQCILELLFT